jgi:7-carboxy-7-deazaguanine synthase
VWCDTPYASWEPEGPNLAVDQIARQVSSYDAKHVVLTGGEPMIMPEIEQLCQALKADDHHITMETAATVYKPVKIDLASLSPKLTNSTPRGTLFEQTHERQRLSIPVIQQFIDSAPAFQLKFVVANEGDLAEIEQVLAQVKGWSASDVMLMPEGTSAQELRRKAAWIGDVCKRTGFRYCPRLHIELYGNVRGT